MSVHSRFARAPKASAVSCARRLLAVATLPLLYAASSVAQDSADDTANREPVKLDTVTVTEQADKPYTVDDSASATRLPLSLRDTPQSVTVVTGQRMQDQNLQSMRDVLDNVTGVYSYAYDSERVVFTSRGFTINNTLYDGVPVAPGLNADSTDATLDTALYERIEVVRGATGLLTGAGNPSAAVNLVRKHADATSFDGSLSMTYGSWNDFRSVADVSTPLSNDGRVRARVVSVYQNADSYSDLYRNEKAVFYGVVDADLTSSTRISLGYDYQRTLPQGNTWGSFPLFFSDGTRTDWSRSVTTATDWSYWNNKTQTAFAELRHDFGSGWNLKATAQRRETDGDSNLFYVYGFPNKTSGEGLTPFVYRSSDDAGQNSFDAYVSGPFDLFGRRHELVVGALRSSIHVDSVEYGYDEDSVSEVGNFYEWDGHYAEPRFDSEGDESRRLRTTQDALYTALRLSLADPLKLIAGARFSRYESNSYYIYDGPDAIVQDHDKLTPYAGLIYDFLPQWSAFASYTRIFSPQTFQHEDASPLDPLEGYSTEIGIKGEHFGGRLNTALTLFDTRQDNVAVADPNSDGINGDPTRTAYLEYDGTRTRGFELEASGELARNWNVSAGWSWYQLEDGDGQDVKTYVPRTLIRTFTSYQFSDALAHLTIGGGVNWQSKNRVDVERPDADYETRFGTSLSSLQQKAVTLVSLMARYQITPQLSVQVNGENLLDRKYYVIDEYGNLYFGAPASVAATLSYRF